MYCCAIRSAAYMKCNSAEPVKDNSVKWKKTMAHSGKIIAYSCKSDGAYRKKMAHSGKRK